VIHHQRVFEATVPGSKSLTNRALILAAMRPGTTRITGALQSDDTLHFARALDAFGGLSVTIERDGFTVTRQSGALHAPADPVFVNGAGTPARFLLAFSAAAVGSTVVTGNARLSERPMGDMLRAFEGMSVSFECLKTDDCLPVRVNGGEISAGEWTVSGAVSSQFLSGLLLLAAGQDGKSTQISVKNGLVSRPYVDMTVDMIRRTGIAIEDNGDRFHVLGGTPALDHIMIEPDASGMSYILGAAALTGQSVRVPHIASSSRQGDVKFAEVLRQMGCFVQFDEEGLLLSGTGQLKGVDVDMDQMPDVVLTLAVVAAMADGPTHIRNIANLRVKECDRISAAATELTRVGIAVEEGDDHLIITPGGQLHPARIETYDDHRVAMAFSLLQLVQDGIVITDPECVGKSFPGYWAEFDRFRSWLSSVAA
jgi:3-phosphoshikimate 1-carboxyvinyltransferase